MRSETQPPSIMSRVLGVVAAVALISVLGAGTAAYKGCVPDVATPVVVPAAPDAEVTVTVTDGSGITISSPQLVAVCELQSGTYTITRSVVGQQPHITSITIDGLKPGPTPTVPVKPAPDVKPTPVPVVTTIPDGPETEVAYVYEKDKGTVPKPVAASLDKLNRERKMIASSLEVDTTNGTGTVPAQYKEAITAAQAKGLPALVVSVKGKVVKVVANPTTEQHVLEALK